MCAPDRIRCFEYDKNNLFAIKLNFLFVFFFVGKFNSTRSQTDHRYGRSVESRTSTLRKRSGVERGEKSVRCRRPRKTKINGCGERVSEKDDLGDGVDQRSGRRKNQMDPTEQRIQETTRKVHYYFLTFNVVLTD